jgi:hypothetical protein
MALRKGKAIMDLAIVEGYDGSQPVSSFDAQAPHGPPMTLGNMRELGVRGLASRHGPEPPSAGTRASRR